MAKGKNRGPNRKGPAGNRRPWIERYFWQGLAVIVTIGVAANLAVRFWPAADSAPTGTDLPSYPVELVAQGRDLYQRTCAACHGVDGEGSSQPSIPAPPLNGSAHSWHHPDSQIRQLIRAGGIQMPAVGAAWSDDEIEAVLAFIKQWWNPQQLAFQTRASRVNP